MINMQKFWALALLLALVGACSPEADDSVGDPVKSVRTDSDQITSAVPLFVEGNLYFTLFHEMGHALVSEFELPVVGREEDAVDRLATLLLTPGDDEVDPAYLIGAMKSWFLLADETEYSDIAWWDAHGTDEQRAYQIACLLYGSDTQAFKKVADEVELPDERREECEEEAILNEDSWTKLLTPFEYPDDQQSSAAVVTVSYGNTKEYAEAAAAIKDMELLEDIAESMSGYRLKPGIRLVAEECGESNAYWHPEERKLTLCYEIVEDFFEQQAR